MTQKELEESFRKFGEFYGVIFEDQKDLDWYTKEFFKNTITVGESFEQFGIRFVSLDYNNGTTPEIVIIRKTNT